MTEQFVTYEIALKLKELGFNEECLAIYREEIIELNTIILLRKNSELNFFNDIKTQVTAPLWQQAIIWLQESKNMLISINWNSEVGKFEYFLEHSEEVIVYFQKEDQVYFETRVQCIEAAILKSFKVLEAITNN